MRPPVLPAAAVAAVLLAACTSPGSTRAVAPSTNDRTTTVVTTRSPAAPVTSGAPTPLAVTPTTTGAGACPLVDSAFVRDAVGMRLGRITVQRSGSTVLGCRIYALQGSSLTRSEHLPGPGQPAVAITITPYRSAADAATAVDRAGSAGANTQSHPPLVCFQTAFYPPDRGRDWACAFADGTRAVVVRTVVTSPALNALRVSREVRDGL